MTYGNYKTKQKYSKKVQNIDTWSKLLIERLLSTLENIFSYYLMYFLQSKKLKKTYLNKVDILDLFSGSKIWIFAPF